MRSHLCIVRRRAESNWHAPVAAFDVARLLFFSRQLTNPNSQRVLGRQTTAQKCRAQRSVGHAPCKHRSRCQRLLPLRQAIRAFAACLEQPHGFTWALEISHVDSSWNGPHLLAGAVYPVFSPPVDSLLSQNVTCQSTYTLLFKISPCQTLTVRTDSASATRLQHVLVRQPLRHRWCHVRFRIVHRQQSLCCGARAQRCPLQQ